MGGVGYFTPSDARTYFTEPERPVGGRIQVENIAQVAGTRVANGYRRLVGSSRGINVNPGFNRELRRVQTNGIRHYDPSGSSIETDAGTRPAIGRRFEPTVVELGEVEERGERFERRLAESTFEEGL